VPNMKSKLLMEFGVRRREEKRCEKKEEGRRRRCEKKKTRVRERLGWEKTSKEGARKIRVRERQGCEEEWCGCVVLCLRCVVVFVCVLCLSSCGCLLP
jgi:hypothetical protein